MTSSDVNSSAPKRLESEHRSQLVTRLTKLAQLIRLLHTKYPYLQVVRLSNRNGYEDDIGIAAAIQLAEDLESAVEIIRCTDTIEIEQQINR
jgi:hypothetical protein